MLYIIYLIGGIVIGIMGTSLFWIYYIYNSTYGTLRQAHDDGETYLFLELDKAPEKIKKCNNPMSCYIFLPIFLI